MARTKKSYKRPPLLLPTGVQQPPLLIPTHNRPPRSSFHDPPLLLPNNQIVYPAHTVPLPRPNNYRNNIDRNLRTGRRGVEDINDNYNSDS